MSDHDERGPSGLGGWLILPMLGLIRVAFTSGRDVLLADSPYSSLGEGASILERGVVGVFGLVAIFLLILFFRKSRWFLGACIGFSLASMASQLVFLGLHAGAGLFPLGMNEPTFRALAGAVLPPAIWIPYMLKSRRVANTFTR